MRAVVMLLLMAEMAALHAQQPPNPVDLKAAYCISVLQKQLPTLAQSNAALSPSVPNEVKKAFADLLEKKNADLRRLQLYLVPRSGQLDASSLAAARKSGEEDFARQDQEVTACVASRQAGKDFVKCLEASQATARIKACNNLSFLPF